MKDTNGNDTPFLRSGKSEGWTPGASNPAPQARKDKDGQSEPLPAVAGYVNPTPRTDSVVFARTVHRDGMDYEVEAVDAEFARQLELELLEAHKRIDSLEDAIQHEQT